MFQLLSSPEAGCRVLGLQKLGGRRGRLSTTWEIGDASGLGKVEKRRLIRTCDLNFAPVAGVFWPW